MFNLKFSFGTDVCSMFPHSSERAKRVSIEQQQKQKKNAYPEYLARMRALKINI